MAKTYAAFYVKDETMQNEAVESNMFKTLVDEIKTLGDKHSFNDIKVLVKRLNAVNVTAFTQEYLVHGLGLIINGAPLKFEMLGDCIFNEFAPELNATLWQSGYNSLNEMRRAAFAGKINGANFLQGLMNGINIVNEIRNKNELKETDYSEKYGLELPIDVVTKIVFEYATQISDPKPPTDETTNTNQTNTNNEQEKSKKTEKTEKEEKKNPSEQQETTKPVSDVPEYVSTPKDFTIKISGNIHNKRAENQELNNVINKLVSVMRSKKRITVRLGKDIYEECILTLFTPTITNLYDFAFEATIVYQPDIANPKINLTSTDTLRKRWGSSVVNGLHDMVDLGIIA